MAWSSRFVKMLLKCQGCKAMRPAQSIHWSYNLKQWLCRVCLPIAEASFEKRLREQTEAFAEAQSKEQSMG